MKPELLAPAGSIESFHAAIEAGADAVYLGLADFNARLRAKNFTIKTLACLLPYARKNRVKLYVTLNTLIKQAELEPVVHTLYQLNQVGVDALIVADLGLIDIARKHFPRLSLHASTQMAVHNVAGARAAARLGMKRVILSRECTLDEVRSIKKQAAVELEVFVHGALCYGVSGLCLASSFLGGSSGNRGRCTQVCRRKFSTAAGKGRYFSCRDLCAVDFLPQLGEIGVVSIKIEGRMKNAAYVFAVVNAYRKALDGDLSCDEARGQLQRDLGRKKTAFFFDGTRPAGVIDAATGSGTGDLVGTIAEAGRDHFIIAANAAVSANDRIRIQPENGFEGEAADVRSVSYKEGRACIRLKKPVDCNAGDSVYLIGRHEDGARSGPRGVAGGEPVPFSPRCPFVQKALSAYRTRPSPSARRAMLWVKIDSVDWLDMVGRSPCQNLIFAGDRTEGEKLLRDEARLKIWRSRLLIGVPPFVPEHDAGSWRALIDKCTRAGVRRGVCSNIGQAEFFSRGFALFADAPLGCLNSAAQAALDERGFSGFVYSYEDDYLNIKAAASGRGIACLFSRVPLFISRVRSAVRLNTPLKDPHDNAFIAVEAGGLYYLLAGEPMCLTHRRQKLAECGIHDFLIDLSFCAPDEDFFQRIIACYQNGTRLPNTSVFNFKAGLK